MAVLTLAACTRGGSAKSDSAAVQAGPARAAAPDAPAAQGAQGAPSAPAAPGAPAAGSKATTTLPNQALIRTADLTVRAADVIGAADRAERLAAARGGSVLDDQRGGSGSDAHADLTLQVPTGSFSAALGEFSALGRKTALHTSTQDVTTQVADVSSRVLSMRAEIAQLRTFYDRAGSITELLNVESTLAQREADLESLEAQQRALQQETSMATIDLHLLALTAPAPAKKAHAPGFLAGARHGWHAFAVALTWLLAALGAALPFLIVAAAAVTAVVLIRRRRPRRPASS